MRDLVRKKSGAELRLITFAEHSRLRAVPAQADQLNIPQGVDPKEGMATNLEEALQLALSTFPSQGQRRVLLISDGNENRGHALTQALRARESGIAVFTVPVRRHGAAARSGGKRRLAAGCIFRRTFSADAAT